ncbi:MAG: hypothetical protein OXN15_07820 [Chloroflexota bacterium]|nr:hypothetical protein [Chloroflexota bacterium]MDE2968936.1 hypothetical protein [Chloroflexota bacterium]
MEFASGVSIKTLDGASSSDVTVTFEALEGDAVPGDAPEGSSLGSLVFSLDAGGTVLSQLAEITIPYTAADVEAAGGRDDRVSVYRWSPVSGTWNEVLSGIQDIIYKTITVSDTALDGTYAIVNTPPADAPEATPTPTVEATPVTPEATPPPTGGIGVSNSLMMGLALLGMLFLVSGGYVLARSRTR